MTMQSDEFLQVGEPRSPADVSGDVIVSADTRRENRVPPGQKRTRKWPVLHAGQVPLVDRSKWTLRVSGLVEHSMQWTWDEFASLPQVQVFGDFHCVTRWSRLGNLWQGVATSALARLVRPQAAARFVLVHAENGWTTNMPIEDFLVDDVLFATQHDGRPLAIDHGGPVRLVVPRLYAWKSAKWATGVEFLPQDRAGFWERGGYHMRGDPWQQERYR